MSKPKKLVAITALYVHIPQDLKEKLDMYCVKNKISKQDVIIQLLESILEDDKK